MSLVVISIDRSKLPEHTSEQFEEWVKFNVGDTASISMETPPARRRHGSHRARDQFLIPAWFV